MSALAIVPKTLYDVESTLQSLVECVETVTPDQEAEFLTEFGQALTAAVQKRDRVAQFMSHLESQADLAKSEIERLRTRKQAFEAALDKLKGYVVRVMESAGVKKLEGSTVTLSLRKCPASVEVYDDSAVPMDYKSIALTLPARLLDQVLDALDFELAAKVLDLSREASSVDKRAVKQALDGGADVAGARFAEAKHTLVRK